MHLHDRVSFSNCGGHSIKNDFFVRPLLNLSLLTSLQSYKVDHNSDKLFLFRNTLARLLLVSHFDSHGAHPRKSIRNCKLKTTA